jgi:hypothetical protein
MRLVSLIALALVLAITTIARADNHGDALAHFNRGVELVDDKDWNGALAEFTRSRELEPTRAALKNAAMCLRELARYDEALDAYEDLVRSYGGVLTDVERASIGADVATLTRYVGEIVVDGLEGATVRIDARARGTLPLAAPLRVGAGSHSVRVEREGASTYETSVVVVSGERRTVHATLGPSAELGRLVVRERMGKAIGVRVDSAAVGLTPWEGNVSAGAHVVTLRGEGDIGSSARAVVVKTGERVVTELEAVTLPGELRVETTPPDATVRIDGRPLAQAELPSGHHVVKVEAPWYVPQTIETDVTSREPRTLRVVLEHVPRVYVEGVGGIVTLPTYASSIQCGGLTSCLGYLIGVRAGYSFTHRFSIEVFMIASMTLGRSSSAGDASVFLSFGGLSAAYRFTDEVPVTARLWVGAGRGSGGDPSSPDVFWSPVGGPELTVGWRASANIVLEGGVGALFFLVPQAGVFNGGIGAAFPLTVALHADL